MPPLDEAANKFRDEIQRRAAMLRKVLIWIVEAHRGVWMIDPASLFDPAYMAEDGYHPNEIAVDWMASEICATVKVAESSS